MAHSRPQSPSFLGHVVGKRGRLQIKPSGSGDENGRGVNICHRCAASYSGQFALSKLQVTSRQGTRLIDDLHRGHVRPSSWFSLKFRTIKSDTGMSTGLGHHRKHSAATHSSPITAVFKASIGLLMNKGRDKLAEKLNEGHVTDQKFRGLVVSEIDELKSKLDGLARKDLLASISLFKEGVEWLYEVFDSDRSGSEHRAKTSQTQTTAETRIDETEEMSSKLEITEKLSKALEKFNEARLEAVKAFSDEALDLPDRLLAMQYRLMATILRTVDNPTDALATCRVCLDELHQVPAVKECFKVELERGVRLRARFNKDKRRQIIFSVCHVNRVIYDVMQVLGIRNLWTLPLVDTGKEMVDPLRDGRIVDALTKQGLMHSSVLWSFGQEEDRLNEPVGIATNTKQQFLIADNWPGRSLSWVNTCTHVKVFDNKGKYVFSFLPRFDYTDVEVEVNVWDIATCSEDMDDKIYLLVTLKKRVAVEQKMEVQVFNKTAELQHKFLVRSGSVLSLRGRLQLTVSRKKVLTLIANAIDVYELSGEFLGRFGDGVFKNATDISASCDGRITILDQGNSSVYFFTEEGQQLTKFNISIDEDDGYFIAHHPTGEHVVAASFTQEINRLRLAIYTVKGELVRKIPIQLDETVRELKGITVTMEGNIAVAFMENRCTGKVVVV